MPRHDREPPYVEMPRLQSPRWTAFAARLGQTVPAAVPGPPLYYWRSLLTPEALARFRQSHPEAEGPGS